METDPHVLLCVARDATLEEIRAAYRRLARETHPDRNPSPDAARRFIEIHRAWVALRDGAAARARAHPRVPRPPTVQQNPRAEARGRARKPAEAENARLTLVRERAALEAGVAPERCSAVRPALRGVLASLIAPLFPAALGVLMLSGEPPLPHPTELGGLAFCALAALLLGVRLPALFAAATGRLAIWVGPGGIHEVRGRRVRSMAHAEIRAIEFGYDPIGRLGFHPFYLELLLGPEARPFRVRRPYGARELRSVITLVMEQETSLK